VSNVVAWLAQEPAVFLGFVAALGLAVGSFLNVVIYRLPVMLKRSWQAECAEASGIAPVPAAPAERFDLVVPRSRCPSCGHSIRVWENVPVLSYLWLRGRCSACGTPIPLRYPLVEALTAVMSVLVAWRFGPGGQAAAALVLTWALIALAFIDLDEQILPDLITVPMLWLGLAVNLGGLFTSLEASVIGAIVGYGFLWTVYQAFRLLTGKEGMGYGDFKLLGMLGAWLGWQSLPAVVLLGSLGGALVGVSLILLRGHDRNVPIPFGPYLALGGWAALLWGTDLAGAYLGAVA
jgi:leader peptidase (prepilin peptidase)/N-methyltransferase